MRTPSELSFGGIYFPPILLAIFLGLFFVWLIVAYINRRGYLRFIWYPPLFLLALVVICTWLVTILIIPI